jgi:hypothetical protein
MKADKLTFGLLLLSLLSACQRRQSTQDPQEIIEAFLNPEPAQEPLATVDLMSLSGFFVSQPGGSSETASHGVILYIEDGMVELSAFNVPGFSTCQEPQQLNQLEGPSYRLAANDHCPEIWFKSVYQSSDDYFSIETNLEAEPDAETHFSPTSMTFVSQTPQSVGRLLFGWPDQAKSRLAPRTSSCSFPEPGADTVGVIQTNFRDFFRTKSASFDAELMQDFFLTGSEQKLIAAGHVIQDADYTFTYEDVSAPDGTLCEVILKEKTLSDMSRKVLAVELFLPRRAGGKYLTNLPADPAIAPEEWISDTKIPENRVEFSFSTSANDDSGLFSERLSLRCRKLPLHDPISVADVQMALGSLVTFSE